MKKVLSFVCILIVAAAGFVNAAPFSDSTVVSLITCSPGEEVYARFGHTAVRVNDPVTKQDIVFNYGMFDFNTHNFYLKFIKGETDYKLAAYDFVYFLPEYIERNSMVWEQVLNLTDHERDKLIEALLVNYQPENRVYRYNFIFDNCATRPRDKVLEAINSDTEQVVFCLPDDEVTFRQWVELYVGRNTWLMLGIDMIFGAEADELATRAQSMFLPEILMKEFNAAKIVTDNDIDSRPLVRETNVLVQSVPEEKSELFILFRPFWVMTILLIIAFVCCFHNKRCHYLCKVLDSVVFISVGLIGCVGFYLTFFSLHPVVGHNYNLLWISPLLLLTGIFQWIRPLKLLTFCMQILNVLGILAAFVVYALSIQSCNIAFIPLMLLLLVRALFYLRIRLKKGVKLNENVVLKISSSGKNPY